MPLPLHEVESFFCFPEIFEATNLANSSTIIKIILDHCKESVSSVIIRRVNTQLSHKFNPSISPNDALSNPEYSLEKTYTNHVKKGLKELEEKFSPETIKALIIDETTICMTAINNEDIELILKIFPGKEILSKISKELKYDLTKNLVSTIIQKIQPDVVDPIKKLRNELISKVKPLL